MKQVFSILLVLICTFFSFGQDPFYIALTKEKGLPSNSIYDIFQDSKGFIWIASNEGLSRYDGYEFVTFTNKYQSSKSGSDIQEDKYGRIWYQNFDGFVFYVQNNELISLKQNTPMGYMHIGIVQDKLFVPQRKGVDMYDLKSLKFQKTILFFNL